MSDTNHSIVTLHLHTLCDAQTLTAAVNQALAPLIEQGLLRGHMIGVPQPAPDYLIAAADNSNNEWALAMLHALKIGEDHGTH